MSLIVGIEGCSFAGKTTLQNSLKSYDNFRVIDEYGSYTKGSAAFPAYPPKSYQEALDASRFFIDVEKERLKDFEIMQLNNKFDFVFLDRTYLTCLAFDYAVRHFTHFDTYNTVVDMWRHTQKIEPDFLLYMNVSQETIRRRISFRKSKCPDHLMHPEFNHHFKDFFDVNLFGKTIKHIDANQSKKQVLEQALKHLK